MMTPKQAEATIAMLADAGIAKDGRIEELAQKLKETESSLSNCRVALQNIGGMALDQFPELAQSYDRYRDPYELIRQCFLKMRSTYGRPPRTSVSESGPTDAANNPKDLGNNTP
jgi:hypothetical protein